MREKTKFYVVIAVVIFVFVACFFAPFLIGCAREMWQWALA